MIRRRLRDGKALVLEYDDLGRLTGKFPQGVPQDRAVLYRYDLTGNLLGAHYDTVGGIDAVVRL